MNIEKNISRSLMIANLIAMIMVIAIHYSTKSSIDTSLGYNVNYIIQEALVNGFARSAVPIFALISGFFLINNVRTFNDYRLTLLNKFHTLLIPYLMASLIIIFSIVVVNKMFGSVPHKHFDLHSIIHPSIQFWFLRDLIILVVISPILFNSKNIIFYGIGVLLFFFWVVNIQPFPIVVWSVGVWGGGWYLLNIETLFFFWFGGMVFRRSMNVDALLFCKRKTVVIVMLCWVGLVLLRVYIDPDFGVWFADNYTVKSILLYRAGIIVGIVSILQVSALIRNNRFLISASGLIFFVFLFHLAPLSYFGYLTGKILDDPYAFYINFPLAVFLVFIFAYITSRYFTRFYNLICGGRNPNKALQRTV